MDYLFCGYLLLGALVILVNQFPYVALAFVGGAIVAQVFADKFQVFIVLVSVRKSLTRLFKERWEQAKAQAAAKWKDVEEGRNPLFSSLYVDTGDSNQEEVHRNGVAHNSGIWSPGHILATKTSQNGCATFHDETLDAALSRNASEARNHGIDSSWNPPVAVKMLCSPGISPSKRNPASYENRSQPITLAIYEQKLHVSPRSSPRGSMSPLARPAAQKLEVPVVTVSSRLLALGQESEQEEIRCRITTGDFSEAFATVYLKFAESIAKPLAPVFHHNFNPAIKDQIQDHVSGVTSEPVDSEANAEEQSYGGLLEAILEEGYIEPDITESHDLPRKLQAPQDLASLLEQGYQEPVSEIQEVSEILDDDDADNDLVEADDDDDEAMAIEEMDCDVMIRSTTEVETGSAEVYVVVRGGNDVEDYSEADDFTQSEALPEPDQETEPESDEGSLNPTAPLLNPASPPPKLHLHQVLQTIPEAPDEISKEPLVISNGHMKPEDPKSEDIEPTKPENCSSLDIQTPKVEIGKELSKAEKAKMAAAMIERAREAARQRQDRYADYLARTTVDPQITSTPAKAAQPGLACGAKQMVPISQQQHLVNGNAQSIYDEKDAREQSTLSPVPKLMPVPQVEEAVITPTRIILAETFVPWNDDRYNGEVESSDKKELEQLRFTNQVTKLARKFEKLMPKSSSFCRQTSLTNSFNDNDDDEFCDDSFPLYGGKAGLLQTTLSTSQLRQYL